MSFVEIARFTDVYEADLAAAFLASHDIEVSVTERFQTTLDPLMQRALGIRLMGYADDVDRARQLLERARQGEFMEADGDDVPTEPRARWAGRGIALFAVMVSGYPATSLPRRLRPLQIAGMLIIVAMVALSWALWLWIK
ncbi:hypothetical protein GCM10009093_03980 [Brevundimonas terrae]|uniref:DUF2007 domain-containing protein n=1 Tax=Brevundimonas terrae TaxID=363631 RepID=A0ABN0Y1P8_9CAUL|nr:DUF2007 domain-containing protein [Brevundimonas terrae]NIJ26051.1 hypothetical protein [Brevundimonas terrae]